VPVGNVIKIASRLIAKNEKKGEKRSRDKYSNSNSLQIY